MPRAFPVFVLVFGLIFSVDPARGQTTVGQFSALDKSNQAAIIRELSSRVVAAFSQRTENGKPIPEDHYQQRREMANLLRALLLRGSTEQRDSLFGEVAYAAKTAAEQNPSADVAESLQKVVFKFSDKLHSPDLVNASDEEQQAYFLNRYVEDEKRSVAEYQKHMDEIIKQEEELGRRVEQQKREVERQQDELDRRTIQLPDAQPSDVPSAAAAPSPTPHLDFPEPEDDPFGGNGGFIRPADQ